MCSQSTQGEPYPVTGCQKSDGSAHLVNVKCKQEPACCVQCCKLTGGCTLPGHWVTSALPLPSLALQTFDPPMGSSATPSHQPDGTLAPLNHPAPGVVPVSTSIHNLPPPWSYAWPLNEHYAHAYYEVHAKMSEAERLLQELAKIRANLMNTVNVTVWVVAGGPKHMHIVNPTPGTFIPAVHKPITDLILDGKVSVYLLPVLYEQLMDAPFVIAQLDAQVLLCDTSLVDSDIIGLQEELSRFPFGKKCTSDAAAEEETSPLKHCWVTLSLGLPLWSEHTTVSSSAPIPPGPLPFLLSHTPESLLTPPTPGLLTPSPLLHSMNGKKMFLWKCICDMYPGMEMLSSLGTAEDIEAKFSLAFPSTKFVLPAFYKHRKPYLEAHAFGIIGSRIALGQTDGGK
ncbi:hypothetical protein PAXRUDRAFT_36118 [Paxillus rubicundulus Ve08.2h10]|uniref:Uncharacterized protein n=1 Tax=Paxillus rubicundulus Ve08.2h10 TaxID=930991 RepID=A0A0D0CYG5_9AGAM|nr:hypothetical protein PAXRUDRAFT_36118 [Paxillus rubicundulus Ve08.2h10]